MRPAALFAALLFLGVDVAEAQSLPSEEPSSHSTRSPLERRVTIRVRDVALRDALDRIAILASMRLSYSGDNLPLDQRVSVARDSALVSELLAELVTSYGVEPRVVGIDHVVLVRRVAGVDSIPRAIAVLDRVVVTGNVVAEPERELPIALDIVSGRAIERRDERALAEILSGSVPGVWMWEQTPTSVVARYGSIRGAASFGLSFPKVYIDGIEVANPLLLTQLSPELVERVEVIRGPQGAALYGSDAISGVVNIVSRHDGAAPDGSHAAVRSAVGMTHSAFTPGSAPMQDHSLTLRFGSNLRSAGVAFGAASSGQYIPQGESRELRGVADARFIGARSTLSAMARVYGKNAGVPANPLITTLNPQQIETDDEPQQLRLYSLGSTATLAPSDAWTYTLTAGIDGYTLRNVSIEQSAVPSVADSVLRNAGGSATRGTMRASVVTRLGEPERVGARLSFALEESILHDRTSHAQLAQPDADDEQLSSGWISNTGITAQANVSLVDALFITAGIRRERLGEPRGESRYVTLPLAGAALTRTTGPASWKLRAAYGRGVRGPYSLMHVVTRLPKRTLRTVDLAPEEQSGVEVGGDLTLWRRLGLHVTRFDQLASGLIQTVSIIDPSNSGPGNRRSWYQLQNVGEISNRGWEGQATFSLGALSLAGAAAFVDSRVQKLASGYTGDLRPGDRMLAVPARTVSGTASWAHRFFTASTGVSRASNWINYDRLAIAADLLAPGGNPDDLTGANLRQYWVSYGGATRLRATISTGTWRGLMLTFIGENLLNRQRGEPDTITIVPGRTITAALTARF